MGWERSICRQLSTLRSECQPISKPANLARHAASANLRATVRNRLRTWWSACSPGSRCNHRRIQQAGSGVPPQNEKNLARGPCEHFHQRPKRSFGQTLHLNHRVVLGAPWPHGRGPPEDLTAVYICTTIRTSAGLFGICGGWKLATV